MTYREFLEEKIDIAPQSGIAIDPAEISPALKDHQRVSVLWALRGGRRAIFARFGLGKTIMQLEWCRVLQKHIGGQALIVMPLNVMPEFRADAVNLLGMAAPPYCRTMAEVDACDAPIILTNYERVRDGDIDPHNFSAVSLDEAATLRSNFADAELPDDALLFRVPLRRAPRKRREEELRMAGDQAATFTWLIFALAIRRALGYGAQRLIKLHDETLLNYRQFSEWELDGADWAFSRLQHCAEQALQEKLNIVETNEPAPTKAEKATYQLQVGLCVREAVSQSCVGTAVSTQNVPAALPLAVLSGVGFERMLGGERT